MELEAKEAAPREEASDGEEAEAWGDGSSRSASAAVALDVLPAASSSTTAADRVSPLAVEHATGERFFSDALRWYFRALGVTKDVELVTVVVPLVALASAVRWAVAGSYSFCVADLGAVAVWALQRDFLRKGFFEATFDELARTMRAGQAAPASARAVRNALRLALPLWALLCLVRPLRACISGYDRAFEGEDRLGLPGGAHLALTALPNVLTIGLHVSSYVSVAVCFDHLVASMNKIIAVFEREVALLWGRGLDFLDSVEGEALLERLEEAWIGRRALRRAIDTDLERRIQRHAATLVGLVDVIVLQLVAASVIERVVGGDALSDVSILSFTNVPSLILVLLFSAKAFLKGFRLFNRRSALERKSGAFAAWLKAVRGDLEMSVTGTGSTSSMEAIAPATRPAETRRASLLGATMRQQHSLKRGKTTDPAALGATAPVSEEYGEQFRQLFTTARILGKSDFSWGQVARETATLLAAGFFSALALTVLLVIRIFARYPACRTVGDAYFVADESSADCSLASRVGQTVEASVMTSIAIPMFVVGMFYMAVRIDVVAEAERLRAFGRRVVAVVAVLLVARIVNVIARGQTQPSGDVYFTYSAAFCTIFLTYKYGKRLHPLSRLPKVLLLALIVNSILLWILQFVLVPLFVRTTDLGKLALVVGLVPFINWLSRASLSSNLYALEKENELYVQPFGGALLWSSIRVVGVMFQRTLIWSLDAFQDQLLATIVWFGFEVLQRSTSPLQSYLIARLRSAHVKSDSRSHAYAIARMHATLSSQHIASIRFMGSALEYAVLFSIFVFSLTIRFYYPEKPGGYRQSVVEWVLLILAQLALQILTDVLALRWEGRYLNMSLFPVWKRHKRELLHGALLIGAGMAIIFTQRGRTIIVSSS